MRTAGPKMCADEDLPKEVIVRRVRVMFIDQRADSKWRINIEGTPLSQVVQKVQKVHKKFWKDLKKKVGK